MVNMRSVQAGWHVLYQSCILGGYLWIIKLPTEVGWKPEPSDFTLRPQGWFSLLSLLCWQNRPVLIPNIPNISNISILSLGGIPSSINKINRTHNLICCITIHQKNVLLTSAPYYNIRGSCDHVSTKDAFTEASRQPDATSSSSLWPFVVNGPMSRWSRTWRCVTM